jgi:ABC-type transport system substrate-binding protein
VQKELLCLGEVHLADRIPDEAITAFEFEPRVTTVLAPSLEVRVLALNMDRTWLASAEAKRGLALAIDIDGLIRLNRGETERLTGPLPSGVPGAVNIPPTEYSSFASRQLIEEAGSPEQPLSLAFNPRKPGMAIEAAYIRDTLNGFGLEAALVEYPGEVPEGIDYDLALVDFKPRTGSAEEFLRFYTGPDNPARYRPETTNGAATVAGDRNGLKAYYRKAFQGLSDDGPYVFLYRKTLRFGVSRGLTNYVPHPLHPRVIRPEGLELREPPPVRDEPEIRPAEASVGTFIEDSLEVAIPQDTPPDFKD